MSETLWCIWIKINYYSIIHKDCLFSNSTSINLLEESFIEHAYHAVGSLYVNTYAWLLTHLYIVPLTVTAPVLLYLFFLNTLLSIWSFSSLINIAANIQHVRKMIPTLP